MDQSGYLTINIKLYEYEDFNNIQEIGSKDFCANSKKNLKNPKILCFILVEKEQDLT